MNLIGRSGNNWMTALFALSLISVFWITIVSALGILIEGGGSIGQLFTVDAAMAESVLGNFPEVIVGILGITITVVSITLQLAATRYTHRVTEMFFHDTGNLGVLAFYVVASVHCVIAAILVRNGIAPQVLLVSTLLIMALTILMLVPYFIYVFAFLDPSRLVIHLKHQAISSFLPPGPEDDLEHIRRSQVAFRGAVEQLSDVALHALSQQDRGIASMTSDALKGIAATYLGRKSIMPGSWFQFSDPLRRCPELEILASESVQRLEADRCWLEWMVLRQMITIYQASLNRMRDVVRLVSINVRQISELALRNQDQAVLELSIRFFNSFLRSAINQADVRSAYNVLDQYRNLAESALDDGREEVVHIISKNLAYYGRLANHSGLPFITESAAFDLAELCQIAHQKQFAAGDAILKRLLKVDEKPESKAEESSLRGVRKAQIKLACYYLSVEAEEKAGVIAQDMLDEDRSRLAHLRKELMAATQPEFWEIVDRGSNFDYMPPAYREQIDRFYALLD